MNLWKIAFRGLQQRCLSSSLTALAMALGISLVVMVLVIHSVIRDSFERNSSLGFDMIVGGKNGSELELVLSSVLQLGRAKEPMKWSVYKDFTTGKYADSVALAVPVNIGDNYQGYRALATTPQYFDFKYSDDQLPYKFADGERFKTKDFFSAVLGAEVARKTNLKVGHTFKITHGISDGEEAHVHDDEFTVTGILKRTGTANDRVLFVNIEGFFVLEGHHKGEHHHHHGHHHRLPDDQREVTAILIRSRDGSDENEDNLSEDQRAENLLPSNKIPFDQIVTEINEGNEAQAVYPMYVLTNFMDKFIGPTRWLLFGLTVMTVLVAGIGVMVSIYNSMVGRQREIAIFRALGARRRTVLMIILLESILLTIGGGVIGILLGHGAVAIASPFLVDYTGVYISPLQFDVVELIVIPALLILATIAGYLPALTAYKTDVSKSLTASP